MSKKEYYSSHSEQEVGLKKLVGMDKTMSTMLVDILKESKPPQEMLSKGCRNLSYMEIPLSCLEYLWIGCSNASIKNKIMAKAAYLSRVNEHNHPRRKMLFTLAENQEVLKIDEENMLKDIAKSMMKELL
jgi:hypothetical protein